MDAIDFVAANGRVTLTIDARTHFFTAISFEVRPEGAPEGMVVRIAGTFSPRVVPASASRIEFAPGLRVAVPRLADLGSTRLVSGSPAPGFALRTLDGDLKSPEDAHGSVLVLDFWATWCIPCWATLKETQALADWAAAGHRPVVVWTIDSLEDLLDLDARIGRLREFLRSQKLTLPVLVDVENAAFGAYGSPGLPSLVVVAPDGTILRHHQGRFPDMQETLRREITEASAPASTPR